MIEDNNYLTEQSKKLYNEKLELDFDPSLNRKNKIKKIKQLNTDIRRLSSKIYFNEFLVDYYKDQVNLTELNPINRYL